MGFVVCGVLVAGLEGCETAAPVAESPETRTPSAPAARPAVTEPGPQDPDAPTEFTTAPSGLKYRVLRQGSGEKPRASDSVEVHYKGWLDNGNVFDSSYDRGQSISFPLMGVIPGWTEGMQYVGEGGMIELEIPSELGYGATPPTPKIPPNSTLHFIVELIAVN
ncbi:MAG: FKBP-type peptidyl-prolyl cis-trans isomerase [Planctomycetaceae bacterium]|nr:FKBP-type peptidyl-prolyl cis-trans isomerase [Planctomycetaceae bacterium]